ncbi:MAG: glycosyltransferase, partial [Nanoarchaeota archaeon]|nr:glycosyltransferase [Nanoarchaeota archaeon]
LASEKCKAINCWNQAAYNDLIRIIDCSKFKKKITVIPFAGRNLKLEKKPKKNLILLFVGSINNPVSFRTKGGLIALETYAELAKKHKNIKFFVRANVGKDLIKEYEQIPGLIFLKKYLPEHKMTQLFSCSDIFLEPLPGMDLMAKSMEFGIPVVGFDYECAFETVFNNKTGFLIKSEKLFGNKDNLEEYNKKLNDNYRLLFEKKECLKYVPEFIEKIEILINDRDLLNKMMKAQHSLVEDGGKYSLKERNKKLLKLINPHIN